MRRGSNPEISKLEEKLYGFNLSSDFVSEHEWGIKKIKNSFGIDLQVKTNKSIFKMIFKSKDNDDKQLIGIDKRTISNFPIDDIMFDKIKIKNKVYWALISDNRNYYDETKSKLNVETLKSCGIYPNREDRHIFSAWDEGSFGILVDSEYKNELKELYEAFKRLDIVIMLGKSNVFENGGLLLLIRSAIPKEEIDKLYDADIDYINLTKAAKDTGIVEALKIADKKYFALSPRWKDDLKIDVVFWLNPMSQNMYNFGWYTVNELKQWIENNGPIIIKRT